MTNAFDLSGRVAIVTGGSGGIGAATALQLAENGASVVIAGRRAEPLVAIADSIGHGCIGVATDVRDEGQVGHLIERTIEAFGRIDILVNNAGGAKHQTPLRKTSSEQWRTGFDLNVHAAFLCSQAALPHMIAQERGAIVNISSLAGQHGTMGVASYSAAKAALQMYTRVSSAEWGPLGIRVNCVAPGLIATDLAEAIWAKTGFVIETACKAFPLRRPGRPEEVAKAVHFLASDAASYITGETLSVAGGPQLKGMIDL